MMYDIYDHIFFNTRLIIKIKYVFMKTDCKNIVRVWLIFWIQWFIVAKNNIAILAE